MDYIHMENGYIGGIMVENCYNRKRKPDESDESDLDENCLENFN